MALTNLGTRELDIGAGWVEYDFIVLNSGREYLVYVSFPNTDYESNFSSVDFGYQYFDFAGQFSSEQMIYHCLPDQSNQHFVLKLNSLLVPESPVIMQARRTPWYSQQSNLGIVNCSLAIDPDSFNAL